MNRQGFPRGFIGKVKDVGNQYMDRKVNLLGVVLEFGVPHHSKGTDCCSILKIMDATQQTPELSVNMFAESLDLLPHIRSHKDIILLLNVEIKSSSQQVYAAVFHKLYSSFALFDGKNINDFTPYQASPTFSFQNSDKEFIRSLRRWCISFPLDAGISNYAVPLKDIKEGQFIDLVCQVLHVYEVSEGNWMLFVWDGTDAPALSLHTKLTDEEEHPLPLRIEPISLPENDLCKFYHVGTVLRISAHKAYGKLGDHFHSIKDWVRFRNLYFEQSSGLWKGVLTPSTKIRLLSRSDNSVKERLRDCTQRITEHGRVPWSSHIRNFLTVTKHENVKFSTLLDVITLSEGYGKLKCIVRVVAICPSKAKDFCSPKAQYRIRMTLEDPTARIHAQLCDKDAEVFFGGYPTLDVLTSKMNKLLGMPECGDSPRNPPWTQLCIAFHAPEEGIVAGNKHFNICDTIFVV